MVPPCMSSIWVLILHVVVPLPLVEFLGQSLGMGYLILDFSLELFSGLLEQLTTLFHHVDFSSILRV
jgi:hypothetical protein